MACDCIDTVNEMLAAHNTRLNLPMTMAYLMGNEPQRLLVETTQIETGRGKPKAKAMFSTFCPFCGTLHKESE